MTVTAERTPTLAHLVVADPPAGAVVQVRAGSRLEVTFPRRGLGSAAWQVADRPGHVVPIGSDGWTLHFVVFERPADAAYRPLRLVRSRTDGGGAVEARELDVVVSP